ncbi:hypothetical protein E8E13_004352 [Curvularia kusanoi]|uniref:Calcineurin-like phosphoesterase domain-containing protein n=1 Tax=Curvularia kusanoi TaxID=90978 RepID=A0A9P4TDY4_CURKU|nr:hypothetical protein E8E13_004352 [Curvularia kusanoi]
MSAIRALVISDTHNTWPYTLQDFKAAVDVFIHCGDVTQYGGLPNIRRVIENIKTVNAELKLVIAGNHDVDLDPVWLAKFAEDDDDIQVGAECLALLESQQAHGLHYLDEGMHAFTLTDGRSFTVYASPYTPAFGEFAFLYGTEEDRFNDGTYKLPEEVDLVITHGPPAFSGLAGYKLDVNKQGEHCGCEKLANALARARPRLCCFGHIHEGRGAAKIDWASWTLANGICEGRDKLASTRKDTETLLVNAAVSGDGEGWLSLRRTTRPTKTDKVIHRRAAYVSNKKRFGSIQRRKTCQ